MAEKFPAVATVNCRNSILTSVKLLATPTLRVSIACKVANACCRFASELLSAEHKPWMKACMDFNDSLQVHKH